MDAVGEMMTAGELATTALEVMEPPTERLVSEWAAERRMVSRSASAFPGRWENERTPYLVEIMDCLNDEEVEEVVVMKASRMGGTEAVLNMFGYVIEDAPCNVLYVQQTVELAQTFSKELFGPFVEDNRGIWERLGGERKSRESGQTILQKRFPGGNLSIMGANSPRGFRMVYKRFVVVDDLDGFVLDAGGEGDPYALAKKRAATDPLRFFAAISSPTEKGFSRIDELYEGSDRRKYAVRCVYCEREQFLVWAQVDFESGGYRCCGCDRVMDEGRKEQLLAGGRWLATSGEYQGRRRGYHLSELYSPFVTWAEMVENFLKAKGLPETLKVFVNTSLGEVWEDEGDGVDEDVVYNRREGYGVECVPEGVVVCTCGVDVQDDRIEYEVVGHGRDSESWSVDAGAFYGNPDRDELWKRLDDLLALEYVTAAGRVLRVRACGIDSGGHHTMAVYRYCRGRYVRGVFAIKGMGGAGKPVICGMSRKNKLKVRLFSIGVDGVKEVLYARLGIATHGPGFCHFPERYERKWFEGLVAEKSITVYVKGVATKVWRCPSGKRNEPLDTRVYALAALEVLYGGRGREMVNRMADRLEVMKGEGGGVKGEGGGVKGEGGGVKGEGGGVKGEGKSGFVAQVLPRTDDEDGDRAGQAEAKGDRRRRRRRRAGFVNG